MPGIIFWDSDAPSQFNRPCGERACLERDAGEEEANQAGKTGSATFGFHRLLRGIHDAGDEAIVWKESARRKRLEHEVSGLALRSNTGPHAEGQIAAAWLYEASMGRDRQQFPELPTSLADRTDSAALIRLNSIILKACEEIVRKRYQSASELRADLLDLQRRFASPHKG